MLSEIAQKPDERYCPFLNLDSFHQGKCLIHFCYCNLILTLIINISKTINFQFFNRMLHTEIEDIEFMVEQIYHVQQTVKK